MRASGNNGDRSRHEQRARLEKALKLADALYCYGITSDQARLIDADGWNQASYAAGVHPPSEQTVEMVVVLLAHREKAAMVFG